MAVIAACSGDDNAPATSTKDSGLPDVATGQPDSAPPPPTCVDAGPLKRSCTAAQCTSQNKEPSVCVANQCVKLKSQECQNLFGAIDSNGVPNEDAIVIGSLFNLRGSDAVNGVTRQNSVALAVSEINDPKNGLGGIVTKDGCNPRPLLYVSCDDSNAVIDADAGTKYDRRAAASHLATELKVAGIVGPHTSANTVDIATNVTEAAKTIIMTPSGGAQEITTIDGGTQDGVRVVWRTVPSDSYQAQALIAYGVPLEQEVKTASGKATIKVAIVNRADTFGNGLRDALKNGVSGKPGLVVDGKPYTDAANTSNVLDVSYDPTKPVPFALVQQILAFQPDIIYYFGFGEFFTGFMGPYEDANSSNDGGANFDGGTLGNKPLWVSSSSGQRAELLTAIKTRPDLRLRARGTSALVISPTAQQFFLRYQAAFPDGGQDLLFGMPQAYDATYLYAYAVGETQVNLGDSVVSINVGKGLANTAGGATSIDVGPANLKKGFDIARQGQKFDYNGASGPLDFDSTIGEAPGDYSIWCVKSDPNTNLPVYNNVTGLTWTYKDGQLHGSYTCQ